MSKALLELLAEQIKSSGPISVAEYMRQCLYHPEHGYYRTRDPLGENGDFTTAPEISQLFGELIGLWHMDLWLRMGAPQQINLIELGPGRGTLMQDFLRVCSPEFVQAVNLHLVDINQVLRDKQLQKLKQYNPTFHDFVSQAIAVCLDGPVFFLANEFFDALPIQQFYSSNERRIDFADGKLVWTKGQGKVVELCPLANEIAGTICELLERCEGSALIIDYGYMNGGGDTLQAVHRHKYIDVLQSPGETDLTAHVNFQQLVTTANNNDVNIYGPTLQSMFLQELGIDALMQNLLRTASPKQVDGLRSGCNRLIDAQAMGQLFKVLAITSKNVPQPSGFEQCIQQAA